MNRTKQEGKVEDKKQISSEKQSNHEHLQAYTQRLLREQRDLARITALDKHDE